MSKKRLFALIFIGWFVKMANGQGLTHARYVPPPTTEITPTEFLEYSSTNTSCFVCGIGNPGFGFRKCSSNYEGDLVETMPLIIASNSLLKTNNSFKGCLTIYTNGVTMKKPSVMHGKEGCRKNYTECHPCLKACSIVEKLCYCLDPGCNSDSRDWGPDWQSEPLSDPFQGANCSDFNQLLIEHTSKSSTPKRIHDDF